MSGQFFVRAKSSLHSEALAKIEIPWWTTLFPRGLEILDLGVVARGDTVAGFLLKVHGNKLSASHQRLWSQSELYGLLSKFIELAKLGSLNNCEPIFAPDLIWGFNIEGDTILSSLCCLAPSEDPQSLVFSLAAAYYLLSTGVNPLTMEQETPSLSQWQRAADLRLSALISACLRSKVADIDALEREFTFLLETTPESTLSQVHVDFIPIGRKTIIRRSNAS
jgi:hypothetical protein